MTSMEMQPLDGVMVIDLTTGIAGGYATKLLADAGADVHKIELPGGDPLRRRGLSEASFDTAGDGLLFRYLHTSKRASVLDLDTEAGREVLLNLYRSCDLVLENCAVDWLDGRGLGRAALAERNARASFLSLSGFGRASGWDGRPANEFTLQAWCGSTDARGREGLAPLHAGGEVGDWLAGSVLAFGALAALRKQNLSGIGQEVDVSQLEAIMPTLTNAGSVWGHFSQVWELISYEDVPSIEPTSDGWIGFCIFTPQQWTDFCLLVEQPEWITMPELNHMFSRIERADEIKDRVRAYTMAHTTAELLERAELLRVPAAPIGHGALLPGIDHFVERGVYVENPRGGFKQPRIPYKSSDWSPRPFDPAPSLGQAEAAGALAVADQDESGRQKSEPEGESIDQGRREGREGGEGTEESTALSEDDLPLKGLRVLDLTAFWAGPYGTYLLSCLGADVIHVESIQRPDGMRFGTQASHETDFWWEQGPTFQSANAGKRGLTLDLMRPEGIEILLELVKQSDVLIENFSPRVMDNFGLDYERLAAANPKLIFVRMPAFGLDGPWRDRVGFAQTMEQVSGLAWLTAYPDSAGEKAGPVTPRACGDPLAGIHAAFATLAALHRRDRTGRGCAIESVMVETALSITAEVVIEYDAAGNLLKGNANRSAHVAPQGLYACSGEDGLGRPRRVAISVETDAQWQSLTPLIGRTEWSQDTRFASPSDRVVNQDEIDLAIEAWTAGESQENIVDVLLNLGIPAAPVTPARLGPLLEPILESDFMQSPVHPLVGPVPVPTQPVRFVGKRGRELAGAAPTLGQHNAEILSGLLGLSDERIAKLQAAGIIGTRPEGL